MHTRVAFRWRSVVSCLALLVAAGLAACRASPPPATEPPRVGQWIWTGADLARFAESTAARQDVEAGVFIGAVHCDTAAMRLVPKAGLAASAPRTDEVTVVIRFENGLDRCRPPGDSTHRFDVALDSAVQVLRARGGGVAVRAVQLDYDAPQRRIAQWAGSVRYLRAHALATDAVWVTSLIAHLREPAYGDLFRDVVAGHVLQVFDTGEPATVVQVDEALRLARRARMPFRLGLGAFERTTRRGPTDHRAWFATVPRFAAVRGYAGVWIFPAGQRWVTLFRETM